jgi:hypothetical protein
MVDNLQAVLALAVNPIEVGHLNVDEPVGGLRHHVARTAHLSMQLPGTRRALKAYMANKTGYALAWLLGIPLPILLIVYLVSRC